MHEIVEPRVGCYNRFMRWGWLVLGFSLVGCMMADKQIGTGFQKRTLRGSTYQIFIPKAYAREEKWPCVVFLHGVGENGTDGEKHMKVGLPLHIRKNAETFPAVAIFPQNKGPWKYVGDRETLVMDALAETSKEFNIDPDRVYLTGLSQGGCSTYDLGAKYPDRWAALLVVCGAGRKEDAPKLAGLPLWAFHGGRDPAIPPSGRHKFDKESTGSREFTALIPGAKYTEFPKEGHFIWDRVYADPEVWRWLWAQKRK